MPDDCAKQHRYIVILLSLFYSNMPHYLPRVRNNIIIVYGHQEFEVKRTTDMTTFCLSGFRKRDRLYRRV